MTDLSSGTAASVGENDRNQCLRKRWESVNLSAFLTSNALEFASNWVESNSKSKEQGVPLCESQAAETNARRNEGR